MISQDQKKYVARPNARLGGYAPNALPMTNSIQSNLSTASAYFKSLLKLSANGLSSRFDMALARRSDSSTMGVIGMRERSVS